MQKIGIENADARDTVNWQFVSRGRTSNCFWRRRVVDTEGLLTVVADVGMNPGHIVFTVAQDDRLTKHGTFVICRKPETFGKISLNQISRHQDSSSSCQPSSRGQSNEASAGRASAVLPILRAGTPYFGFMWFDWRATETASARVWAASLARIAETW